MITNDHVPDQRGWSGGCVGALCGGLLPVIWLVYAGIVYGDCGEPLLWLLQPIGGAIVGLILGCGISVVRMS